MHMHRICILYTCLYCYIRLYLIIPNTCACVHTCIFVYTRTFANAFGLVYVFVHVNVSVYVYIHVYTYVYIL